MSANKDDHEACVFGRIIASDIGKDDDCRSWMKRRMYDSVMRSRSRELKRGGLILDRIVSMLKFGMTVTRKAWADDERRDGLELSEDGETILLCGRPWSPTQDDIRATDWECGD